MAKQEFRVGTCVKVVNVDPTDNTADCRNIGRVGVIGSVILDAVETGCGTLYAVRFVDNVRHEERHWMDVESNLPVDQSAHYHSELEAI